MAAVPPVFEAERQRGKAQARTLRRERRPETVSVDTWLGGYRYLFPETRLPQVVYDQTMLLMPFRREFGGRRMCDVSGLEAQAWTMKNPSHVKLLKHAWERAKGMGVVSVNIWDATEKPFRVKPKVAPPADQELWRIVGRLGGVFGINGPAELGSGTPMSDLVLVAAFTGARQGGLVKLRKKDVDFANSRMTVTEKGNKTREMHVPAIALEALKRRDVEIGHPTFSAAGPAPPRRLFPFTAATVQARWKEARGDFPHGFHSLRHYCSTWMEAQGCDQIDIAIQLGHTDEQGRPYQKLIERVYSHPDPDAALRRIAEVVG